jgi:hypothetical protein
MVTAVAVVMDLDRMAQAVLEMALVLLVAQRYFLFLLTSLAAVVVEPEERGEQEPRQTLALLAVRELRLALLVLVLLGLEAVGVELVLEQQAA